MTLLSVLISRSVCVFGQTGAPASGSDVTADIDAVRKASQEDFLKLRFGSESDVYSCEFPFDPKGMPPEGNTMPAEVCDKISRTWFWSTGDGPGDVKSSREITEMLKLCNGRNANYLLNVPPDRDGLISGAHLKRLKELALSPGEK